MAAAKIAPYNFGKLKKKVKKVVGRHGSTKEAQKTSG
jgi:hypothetical protein